MTEDSSVSKETFEERLNRETRPPSGQRLILHSIRFAEVIRADDYDKFEKGLDLLYQGVLKNTSTLSSEQNNYRSLISDARRAFLSSRWVNLQGFVSKSFAGSIKKGIIVRPIRELPSGVESMSFFMCQMIPSSIVVVIHVEYLSTISDSLNELFTKKYSERIEELQHGGTMHTPPERIKEETIQDFFLELQGEIESFMSNYFKGVFLSDTSKEAQVRCPSVRLFSLQNMPFTSKETLISWIKENHRFIDTFGYLPIPDSIYQFNNEYLLFNHQIREHRENPICLSLLSSESLFSAPEAHQMYGTPLYALKYKYDTGFNNLMTLIAYNSFLWWHSRKAIYYRNNLPTLTSNIKGDIKEQFDSMCNAKSAINDDYFDFVRLSQELEYITSPKHEKWLFRETAEFELLENPHNLPHYAKEMVSNINFLTSNIVKEYSLLNERYSDLFETMNTQSNFISNELNIKYQKSLSFFNKVLVALTVMMLIAIIVQIIIAIHS
jgi:hypothetical protein